MFVGIQVDAGLRRPNISTQPFIIIYKNNICHHLQPQSSSLFTMALFSFFFFCIFIFSQGRISLVCYICFLNKEALVIIFGFNCS